MATPEAARSVCSATSKVPRTLVATPEAARSVCPATSSVPLRSVLVATVKSAPVTSIPEFASTLPVKVACSATFKVPRTLVATPVAARSV